MMLLVRGMMFACLCWAGAALAAATHIDAAVPQARLAGSGLYTWFGLKVYTAELYVGPKGYAPDLPFALDLRYARNFKGSKIAEVSVEQMAKIGAGSSEQRALWQEKMQAVFPDVRENSHITGVNLPGVGARFFLDGAPLGAIDDPAFARAFFAIWLDPATTAPDLRKALLRQAAPQ